jgi:peptidoglycan/LPS O-acetylase OafA/YrhL
LPTASNPAPLLASATSASSTRIPELDGIRGLAIGMVLVWHLYFSVIDAPMRSVMAYVQAAGRLSWSGVDLFFVLSGFLIGGILLDNRDAANYFQVFYIRRFFRIVPVYVFSLGIGYLLMRLTQLGTLPNLSFLTTVQPVPWASHLFFLQNFWMAARNSFGVFAVTWSLAVEEQFYVTFPMAVRILSPRRLLILVCGVTLAAPFIRLALLSFGPAHPLAGFVLLPCRADALMLGVLGAIALRNPYWKARLANNRTAMLLILGVLGAGLVLLAKFSFNVLQFGMQFAGYTWIAVFYLFFLLYALTNPASWVSRFLRVRPLRWLGSIAYGVYLYHMLVAWAVFGLLYSHWPMVNSLPSAGVSLLALLLTLALAQVSWAYFEKPFLSLGHHTNYEFNPAFKRVLVPAPEPQRTT